MNKLINPSDKYVTRIEGSKHFLNHPKHMLNHDCDCLYRQGIVISPDTAIKYVADYLNLYHIESPIKQATEFVRWRQTLTMVQFVEINVNAYIENTPQALLIKLDHQIAWQKAHTEYYPWTDVSKGEPSYPYRYQ